MLKLFPNISDVLEQIRSFAASVIAEVTLFQYSPSDRLLLILLASGSSLNRVFRVLCEIPVLRSSQYLPRSCPQRSSVSMCLWTNLHQSTCHSTWQLMTFASPAPLPAP